MGLNPKGRNWGVLVNWDDLGKAYAGFIVAWTLTLTAGIVWLFMKRRVQFIRMRNIPLAIASTAFLHVYLVKILLAYTTNGHFLCSAEFWIMSIYLPFGIALFQANVTQLRDTSYRQGRLLTRQLSGLSSDAGMSRGKKMLGWHLRWKNLSEVEKSYVLIGCGMLAQLIMTAALYATSPILQGDWSSFGDISHSRGQAKCRRSLTWIPSAFWQLFWTWCYGPYMLYTIRNIHDAHYWRLQTILSIVSGLPGTPLWIAAAFSREFHPVNIWWVPPMWLAPGIVVMQVCTIFFPIYEYYKQHNAVRSMSSEYSSFDTKSYDDSRASHTSISASTLPASQQAMLPESTEKLFRELAASGSRDKNMYRMSTLEKALLINPAPLLCFAATKDFTAENIIFLVHIKEWREAWRTAPRAPLTGEITAAARRDLFRMGVDIYTASVCGHTADFPLNLEGYVADALHKVFGSHMASSPTSSRGRSTVGFTDVSEDQRNLVFDLERISQRPQHMWTRPKEMVATSLAADSAYGSSNPTTPDARDHDQEFELEEQYQEEVSEQGGSERYPGFDEKVFDDAEASIKYLVLTNTWRKFVKSQEGVVT